MVPGNPTCNVLHPFIRLIRTLQEEPLNNGSWTYVEPRILTAANVTQHHKGKSVLYAGREPTSSVATGSKVHCGVDDNIPP